MATPEIVDRILAKKARIRELYAAKKSKTTRHYPACPRALLATYKDETLLGIEAAFVDPDLAKAESRRHA